MNTRTLLTMSLLAAAESALAQSCTGVSDLSGHYMFVATRQLFSPPAPAPVNVTNVESKFSATPVGSLVKSSLGTAPFAVVGRLVADGQGGILAGAPDAAFITIRVGTYTVSPECTLNITITDGFLPPDLIAPPIPGVVKFTGVLQSRGGEASLIQASGGSGVSVTLSRAHVANSCGASTFTGSFGLAASGVDWSGAVLAEGETLGPQSLAIFSMVGRIVADGAGSLFLEDGTIGKPLQLSGTYSLAPDCTGTAKLVDGKITRAINFVLTQANTAQNFTASGVGFSRPLMRFVLADPKMAVTGVGREATGRL